MFLCTTFNNLMPKRSKLAVGKIGKLVKPVSQCELYVCVSLVPRLVVYADSEGAKRAVRELNDSELDGRRLFLREVCGPLSVVVVYCV